MQYISSQISRFTAAGCNIRSMINRAINCCTHRRILLWHSGDKRPYISSCVSFILSVLLSRISLKCLSLYEFSEFCSIKRFHWPFSRETPIQKPENPLSLPQIMTVAKSSFFSASYSFSASIVILEITICKH